MKEIINTSDDTNALETILSVFSEYLDQKEGTEFIRSKKFGLLCISLWSTHTKEVYDIVRIDSFSALCETLIELLIHDYLLNENLICISENELESLYADYIQKYIVQLPEYQNHFYEGFRKAITFVQCKSV